MTAALQKTSCLTKSEKHNVQVEIDIAEWNASKSKQFYSIVICIFGLLAQLSSQWERASIAPAYQFQKPKNLDVTDKYDYYYMRSIIGSISNFALLIGPALVIPLIVAGAVSGTVAEKFNRKWIVVSSFIFTGLCTAGFGIVKTFWQLLILRVLQGVGSGFYIPAVMSLFIDYFPIKHQTTAMTMMGIGVLIGMACNQMVMNLIALLGWRLFYIVLGLFWTGVGILSAFVM